MHHGKTKPSRRLSGFSSPVPFPLQLQRTVAINGLHSTPTGDLPCPLTSRRPRPIKGTVEHRLHTTFTFLTLAHSIRAHIDLPSSSVIAHFFPTVAGSPPTVHHPVLPSVRTPPPPGVPLPFPQLAVSSLTHRSSLERELWRAHHRSIALVHGGPRVPPVHELMESVHAFSSRKTIPILVKSQKFAPSPLSLPSITD
jgi:hypothetical protein